MKPSPLQVAQSAVESMDSVLSTRAKAAAVLRVAIEYCRTPDGLLHEQDLLAVINALEGRDA